MRPKLKQTALVAAAAACTFAQSTALAEVPERALIERGGYLVGIGGCADCHMPFKLGAEGPVKDVARGLSGHPQHLELPAPPRLEGQWNWAGSATMTAFVGPWGTTYAANLTPDRETGIGAWKVQDFIRAFRTGKRVGLGRPILPPMPWQALAGLSDEDLRAIYAYLMAQPALKNRVPDYTPPAAATAKAGGR